MIPETSVFVGQLVAQRNRAIACALLSIAISLSLVMSTFLSHREDLVRANTEIQNLQRSLIATQNALKENEDALLKARSAFGKLVTH